MKVRTCIARIAVYLRRCRNALSITNQIGSVVYSVFLWVLFMALELIGEKHWLCSVLLFLPPLVWLLPFLIMTPLSLVTHPRLIWLHLLCVYLTLVVYANFRWAAWPLTSKAGKRFAVLTNNFGQNNDTSPEAMIRDEQPQIIALQESTHFAYLFSKRFADDYHTRHVNQFTLISEFPMNNSRPVVVRNHDRLWTIASRTELIIHELPVAFYNVHLPTPRHDFSMFRIRPIHENYGVDGWLERIDRYKRGLEFRVKCTEFLAEIMKSEHLPVLAVGDFNIPAHGYLYRSFAAFLNDAFAEGGRGYGWTFPGSQSQLSNRFIRPWLRLDYIFYNGPITVDYCRVERDRSSEHRAVVARLALE